MQLSRSPDAEIIVLHRLFLANRTHAAAKPLYTKAETPFARHHRFIMHPEFITHREEKLALEHLSQSFGEFDWTPKGGEKTKFKVSIRYSNHCYSRSLEDGKVQAEDDVVVEVLPLRLFCRQRYDHTPKLCEMIKGLFIKPSTTVSLTYESNWTIYQLYAKPAEGAQYRYCVFFRVRRTDVHDMVDGSYPLGHVRGERVCPDQHGQRQEESALRYRGGHDDVGGSVLLKKGGEARSLPICPRLMSNPKAHSTRQVIRFP
ncbi:hypothetical protein X735_22510 [Mesorhizobium sp. L2C085B000]|uniref:hypothetical protein n=1 Tax=Mesorhizobium sp. L2C085B000 TaxID=1287117 RepID=UPI0003D0183E|nr:hypothetical protein [Mesorhizobium sp. L2C085B000]ESZ12402.1 hypothetical protein X735_22510 [Mesorhizobium sp. L2C085B000]